MAYYGRIHHGSRLCDPWRYSERFLRGPLGRAVSRDCERAHQALPDTHYAAYQRIDPRTFHLRHKRGPRAPRLGGHKRLSGKRLLERYVLQHNPLPRELSADLPAERVLTAPWQLPGLASPPPPA